jgi:hypothetical protein
MRTFIVSMLAVAIYAPQAFGQDAIPLEQALSSGKVEAAITGIGGSTGDTILITVGRRTPDLLRLTLTPGTVFKSVSGAVQNMAGASIKGQRVGENSYRPETEIVLVDNYTHSYVIEAYCLDFHKGNPGATDRFDIASVDGQAARLLAIGKDKPASIGAIQAALWMLREGLSPAQVQARPGLFTGHRRGTFHHARLHARGKTATDPRYRGRRGTGHTAGLSCQRHRRHSGSLYLAERTSDHESA